jgi:hypothetical protein
VLFRGGQLRSQAPVWLIVPYLVAVCLPLLASARRGLVLFGAAISISSAAAGVMASAATFPSVWCYFAALLSAGLYLHFRSEARAAVDSSGRSLVSKPLRKAGAGSQ